MQQAICAAATPAGAHKQNAGQASYMLSWWLLQAAADQAPTNSMWVKQQCYLRLVLQQVAHLVPT